MTTPKSLTELAEDGVDPSILDELEERAAIMEFDGGMSRSEAEAAAIQRYEEACHAED